MGSSPKSACLVVPPLFRADSGTNLIKQGENVKRRPNGSVTQLAKCSHSKRVALGSSPGRTTVFPPCDKRSFPKCELLLMKIICFWSSKFFPFRVALY